MNVYMRRDIMEKIEERMPWRGKVADSTSGIDAMLIRTSVIALLVIKSVFKIVR